MSRYTQLSLEERCSIARLREAGQSSRQVAAALDRQPSTIARELKRNTGRKVGYRPAYAQAQAAARRWTGSRIERDDSLRQAILERLTAGWSPEQIAGRFEREAGRKVISHESIYRFVYAQLKRTNDTKWRLYLPRAKIKRGWRTKGGWPRSQGKCSIHERPANIAARREPGHWEADCMLFRTPGPAILIAHERHSRITIALPQTRLRAQTVADDLARLFERCTPDLRQSITFDRPPRHPDLLLRPPRPMAKGRHRKCHRTPPARAPHQNQHRRVAPRTAQCHPRQLQQHSQKMPRLQNSCRNLQPVALRM
jgi:IS30 family transposase